LLGIKDVKSIIKAAQIKRSPTGKLPHLLAASNQREPNPNLLPMTCSSQIEILNLPPNQSTQNHLKPILMPNDPKLSHADRRAAPQTR